MKKMLTIIVCIAISMLLLFGVPFGINEVYKIGGYVTDWGATEVLLYWGSVLGGLATLWAIYTSLLFEKRKERYQEISKWLFDALDNLDANTSLSFKKRIDEKKEYLLYRINQNKERVIDLISTQEFYGLVSKACMCKKLEIRLSSDEKRVFQKTLTLLRMYEEEYVKLLHKLREYGERQVDSIFVENTFEKIEKLYFDKYDSMVDSVQEGLKKLKRQW
jgi:hypothetical protein